MPFIIISFYVQRCIPLWLSDFPTNPVSGTQSGFGKHKITRLDWRVGRNNVHCTTLPCCPYADAYNIYVLGELREMRCALFESVGRRDWRVGRCKGELFSLLRHYRVIRSRSQILLPLPHRADGKLGGDAHKIIKVSIVNSKWNAPGSAISWLCAPSAEKIDSHSIWLESLPFLFPKSE